MTCKLLIALREMIEVAVLEAMETVGELFGKRGHVVSGPSACFGCGSSVVRLPWWERFELVIHSAPGSKSPDAARVEQQAFDLSIEISTY